MLDDSAGCTLKPVVNSVSSSAAVPSLTLTSASHANLHNGAQRCSTSSANLLQAFDRLSVSTSSVTSSTTSACRRMSLGTLRVNSLQQKQASSSGLFVDGSTVLSRAGVTSAIDSDSRRPVASGRSPRVRRKLSRVATGKGKDKRSAKLSKVVIQTKPPVVDDWLKFDFSSVMSASAVSDVGAGDDVSADEDGGAMAAAAGCVDMSQRVDNSELYAELAQLTKSVGTFTKLAYPDMYGHVVTPFKEAFYEKRFGVQR